MGNRFVFDQVVKLVLISKKGSVVVVFGGDEKFTCRRDNRRGEGDGREVALLRSRCQTIVGFRRVRPK